MFRRKEVVDRLHILTRQQVHFQRGRDSFNGVLAGCIPLAAGFSSSSAVVVTVAKALTFITGLSIIMR